MLKYGTLWLHASASMKRVVIGFLISTALSFLPIFTSALKGIQGCDLKLIEVGTSFELTRLQIIDAEMIVALNEAGYSIDYVDFVQMAIGDALVASEDGSVDAALEAGSLALNAINAGSDIVATGEGLVDGIIVTAVSTEFAENYPEIVERFTQVEEETKVYVQDLLYR